MSVKQIGKILVFFSLSFICLGSMANNPLATKEQIGRFKNSITCVVMDEGVSFFNAPIKAAVEKFWKTTSYEFIDQKEFEKRRSSPKYSFIVMVQGEYDKDPGGVSYSFMSLLLGDPSNNLKKMPELCAVPLAYTGDLESDYEYIIPEVVKFMQIHVKNLEKDRFLIALNGLRYYNKSEFKDKVLLLNKEKMAPDSDTPEKIKTVYPYDFKLLTPGEMQKELATNPVNKLIHFHVGPYEDTGAGKSFDMIFDSDGNLYYYSFRKITNDNPDGFNLNDFSNIK